MTNEGYEFENHTHKKTPLLEDNGAFPLKNGR